MRDYVLKETNWKVVKDTEYKIALLPWGATEAHNYHLPYGTDSYLGEEVAIEAARKVWEKGHKIIVLPCVPFGVNTGQIDVNLCMNMNPSTQLMVLRDLIQVLDHHGIDKLVIVNAHGGNHFKQMIREVYLDFPDVFVGSLNWWQFGDVEGIFEEPGDHAGELETSAVMHFFPDLVRPLNEAGSGASIPYRITAMREGKVTSQRIWTKATVDTGVGDPKASTAEKGKKFVEETTDQIAEFLIELASISNEELYSKR
ncbi:creatininase family protein [Membranicola marinus]|uniref:Creatininase family protein n=1 Tax=Membranihabitans marinus TaxID=1227546 RepID=A0A953HPB9_9BACT|nr:creatininase family protein [Membranihabitans marinus]MBY5959287.1 creatininase family protein [Membranihabitans marinus]